mgnify:CR=1 FL=1
MLKKFATKTAAIAGLISLAVTAFAGTPASATATTGVRLSPEFGTSLNMPAGTTFSLEEVASSDIAPSTYPFLKFKVTNNDGVAASVKINGVAPAANTVVRTLNGSTTDETLTSTAGESSVFGYAAPDIDSNWVGVSTIGNLSTFQITSSDATKSASYAITAFFDMNENGAVDNGEYAQTQTVKFLKAADLAVTTSLTPSPLYEGTTSVHTNVRLSINNEQAYLFGNTFDAGDIYVVVTDGLANNPTILGEDWAGYDYAGNYANDFTVDPLVGGEIVKLQAYWGDDKIGNAQSVTVIKPVTGDITAQVTKTDSARNTNLIGSNADADVAVNEQASVQAVVLDTASPAAPIAGRLVYYALTTNRTLSAENGVTITMNGKTYDEVTGLPTLTTYTDAKGAINLTISTKGFESGDYVRIHFQSENVHQYLDLNQVDREYTGYVTNFNTVYTTTYHINRGYVEGAQAPIDLVVYDQFGKLIEDGWTARALFIDSDRATGASAAGNSIVPIVGGKATMLVTDDGKGSGWNWYEIQFIKRSATYGDWDWSTEHFVTNFWLVNTAAEDLVAGKLQINNATKDTAGVWQIDSGFSGAANNAAPLSDETFVTWDSRDALQTMPAVSAWALLSGTISSASTSEHFGQVISSPLVTVEGEGLQFESSDSASSQSGVGKYSFYATETGTFDLLVASHKSGAQTVKISVGNLVSYVVVNFDLPASDAGTALTIDAPTWSMPGKTVIVSSMLKDKFGNAVSSDDVKLTVNGLGGLYQSAYGSDDKGLTTAGVALGINEGGALSVTASYDQNGDGDYTDTNDIVVKKSVLIQNSAVVPADAKLTVTAPASSQNGRAVDVAVKVATAAGAALPGVLVTLVGQGAGYVEKATVYTDEAGVANFKLVAGAYEIGDAVLTATAGAVSATGKVSFGVTDAGLNLAGKRVTADWSFAAGKRVIIYRDGVQIRNFVATSDAAGSYSFSLKKGTHSVKIKIGGVTIDSQSYKIG